MKWRSALINCGVVLLAGVLAFGGWQLFGPTANQSRLAGTPGSVKHLQLTAVGDSLTHGVGDATSSGGYVALVKTDLAQSGEYKVTTSNFGVTGNTAPQVQKRLDAQPKMQKAVRQADIITLTVGGNDLMAVLRKHFFDITSADVQTGIAGFQTHLTKLLTTMRKLNPQAPIYVFGIYNPFYVYFPKLTAMTDSVTKWNAATKQTLAKQSRVHFVDIDQVLSTGATQSTDKNTKASLKKAAQGDSDANPLIFSQDHFHPNNAGYAQMTRKLWASMQASQSEWEK